MNADVENYFEGGHYSDSKKHGHSHEELNEKPSYQHSIKKHMAQMIDAQKHGHAHDHHGHSHGHHDPNNLVVGIEDENSDLINHQHSGLGLLDILCNFKYGFWKYVYSYYH